MHPILIRSKLHRPPPPPSAIPRFELLQRLNNGINAKVTLVAAPAGYGKSTLVGAWFDQLEAMRSRPSGRPAPQVGWLSLEEADNHLPRFVRYLVTAIEEKYPQICAPVIALLDDSAPASIEALTDVLGNSLTQLPTQFVLALDDLHLIDDKAIHAFLTRLIQHTSNKLHLVLITRVDPPLPLSRWRAQGQLNELRLHSLSFTLDETTLFLRQNLGQMPTPAMITVMHERTEGWAVGLRLVALALWGATDYSALVAGFEANSNRYIFDYLMDDVLAHQPPALQQFLICTSILSRFCPALCAAVLEIHEAAAQQEIADVARANLFLIEVSSPDYWYRYHHQFQSLLLSRLYARYDQEAVATLHRHAAAWLAEHEQVDEAIRHLKAISDHVAIADLIESRRIATLNEHRFHDLADWLALLPGPVLNQRPALLVGLAWVQEHRLEFPQCLATVQRAAALLHEHAETLPEGTYRLLDTELVVLRIAVDRALEPATAMGLIEQSWEQVRPYLSSTHCLVVVWLALNGHLLAGSDLAPQILSTAIEQSTEWPTMARCRLHYSAGILHLYRCNLASAERAFQRGLHLAGQFKIPLATILCNFGLALVAGGRNQPELAEIHHLEVVKEPMYQDGLRAVFSTYSLLDIYAARGRPEAGRGLVERLKTHALLIGRPYLLNQVAALEAYLALVCGDLPTALRWALTGSHSESQSEMYSASDRIPLIRARILMADGAPTSLHAANQILAALHRRHESEHDLLFGIEVMVLQVMTWDQLGETETALRTLGNALQLVIPNGFVGPFVAQGRPMLRLLTKLEKQPEYVRLVRLLLSAFPPDYTRAWAALAQELLDPLTDREFDLLRLLAERLSNKEIAQRLVISTHTVRNHTASIFSKLQVDNRLQAVERARELSLLPAAQQRTGF